MLLLLCCAIVVLYAITTWTFLQARYNCLEEWRCPAVAARQYSRDQTPRRARTAIGQTSSPSRPKLQHYALSRHLGAVPLLLDLLDHKQACVQEAFDTIGEAALLSAREAGRRVAGDAPVHRQRQAKRVAADSKAQTYLSQHMLVSICICEVRCACACSV